VVIGEMVRGECAWGRLCIHNTVMIGEMVRGECAWGVCVYITLW